jgi:hypothetical protein
VAGLDALGVAAAEIADQGLTRVGVAADVFCRAGLCALHALGAQAGLLIQHDAVALGISGERIGRRGACRDAGGVVALPADDRHVDDVLVLLDPDTGKVGPDVSGVEQRTGQLAAPAARAVVASGVEVLLREGLGARRGLDRVLGLGLLWGDAAHCGDRNGASRRRRGSSQEVTTGRFLLEDIRQFLFFHV